jgi:hypothetical protein
MLTFAPLVVIAGLTQTANVSMPAGDWQQGPALTGRGPVVAMIQLDLEGPARGAPAAVAGLLLCSRTRRRRGEP